MTYGDPQYPHGGQPYGSTPGGPPPGPPGGPYGPPAGPPGANPYGQPPSHPYGQPPADPYGQPPADPFGAPAVDPFSQPPSPYGQPSSGPPAAPLGAPMSGPPGPSEPYFGGPPPPPPKSGSRVWLAVLGGVVVLAVLAACGVGGYFLLQGDEGEKPTASPSSGAPDDSPSKSDEPEPTESEEDDVDISSRKTDPEPLTVKELFGTPTVDVPTGKYPVVKTEVLTSCKSAVTGPSLGTKLTSLGCTQVVRAAINSPGNRYGITAGVFNLAEDNGSEVTQVIKAQKGDAFLGLVGTGASAVINQATSMMYWQPIGHYLVYVVIVRGDRQPATTTDPAIKQIGNDILITHLGTLLQKREQ